MPPREMATLSLLLVAVPTGALFLPTELTLASKAVRTPLQVPLRTVPPLMAQGPKGSAKERGFYTRPSAAVERGGGFYVPGLEGYRWRLAVASVLSAALVLNRLLSPGEAAQSQLASEILGSVGCAFLLAQVPLAAAISHQSRINLAPEWRSPPSGPD